MQGVQGVQTVSLPAPSWAMLSARAGTQRMWPGANRTPAQQSAWDTFRKLAEGPRDAVLIQTLSTQFAVSLASSAHANDTASITVQGQTLATLHKPTTAFLKDHQIDYMRAAADLQSDRLEEITVQTGQLLPFFGMVSYLSGDATKWTLRMADTMLSLCKLIEMPVKMGLDVARPIALSSAVQPVIQTPGHPSFPSGHATESFVLATLFSRLFYDVPFDPAMAVETQNEVMRYAARIATNRTVAGVHYPTDSMAGAIAGMTMAEGLINLLDGKTATPTRTYRGDTYEGDFNLSLLGDALKDPTIVETGTVALDPTQVPVWMQEMWAEVKSEWG
ncbi:phosphatase PAP2 family protein [Puniceibacterium sediminis]|uniref:phosphatase PAP2 family protein n=1 Tax=Puniceibacterium sediminis TaxID=1608407 RepID=UPI001FE2F8EE|nr:phosphatase PAP2 family protein [Puniceibacterium sediminis]